MDFLYYSYAVSWDGVQGERVYSVFISSRTLKSAARIRDASVLKYRVGSMDPTLIYGASSNPLIQKQLQRLNS